MGILVVNHGGRGGRGGEILSGLFMTAFVIVSDSRTTRNACTNSWVLHGFASASSASSVVKGYASYEDHRHHRSCQRPRRDARRADRGGHEHLPAELLARHARHAPGDVRED